MGLIKMSKQLEVLIERAERKGQAILNGRMTYDYGSVGRLREKYAIEIDGDTLQLRHWGTETLVINMVEKTILKWYGESSSDRDSMNYILRKFDIAGGFRYRPSVDEFTFVE